MPTDVQLLAQEMFAAALPILNPGRQAPISLANAEFTKLAFAIASSLEEMERGQINRQQGITMLEMQRNASAGILLAVLQGLLPNTVQMAIDAAYGAARATVRTSAIVGPWPP